MVCTFCKSRNLKTQKIVLTQPLLHGTLVAVCPICDVPDQAYIPPNILELAERQT